MPVTHGVAGSSPVHSAKRLRVARPFLFMPYFVYIIQSQLDQSYIKVFQDQSEKLWGQENRKIFAGE